MEPSAAKNNFNLKTGDALLIVDVQNDFLPGGALAVPFGNEVIPVLNGYLDTFRKCGLPVFATRDWHPPNHCSFSELGGIWPVHCVAGTEGAQYAAGLDLPPTAQTLSKAEGLNQEAYSGFQGTDLKDRLKKGGVRRLFIGGLATDYCVLQTVKDALQHGFTVYLLEDAIRAVDVHPGDGQTALDEMSAAGIHPCTLERLTPIPARSSALLTDLYQLTMLQGYFDRGMNDIAVFEFFVRRLPKGRGFLVAAGLEQVLQYLESPRFTSRELEWLAGTGHFKKEFLDFLEGFRFTGDVHAMPEGTVFFADEPILRITAPLPQSQLVESRIINLLHYQTLIASKAARMVLATPEKTLIDFGLRRAHGSEAGLFAARASYLAGFAGTATVQAGALFDIPLFGTMAHSFIQAHENEVEAFENFALSHPDNVILLLDTYDTERATHRLVELAPRLKEKGVSIKGVRLDSGDLAAHARNVRRILDAGGLKNIRIFASGNLDEYALQEFARNKAPIDGFGIGSRMSTSNDVPYLDCVYKLQEYGGRPRRKRSEGKATWPGRKQVYRRRDDCGRMTGDILTLTQDNPSGEPLLQPCMQAGRRLSPPTPLAESRRLAAQELSRLPEHLRALEEDPPYPVEVSRTLRDLADQLDEQT